MIAKLDYIFEESAWDDDKDTEKKGHEVQKSVSFLLPRLHLSRTQALRTLGQLPTSVPDD
jgi:hypothetical protein